MARVSPNAIHQMAAALDQLSTMKRERVLDVGCGGCELSRDLLRHKFKEIDFLDRNVEAIKIAMRLKLDFNLAS